MNLILENDPIDSLPNMDITEKQKNILLDNLKIKIKANHFFIENTPKNLDSAGLPLDSRFSVLKSEVGKQIDSFLEPLTIADFKFKEEESKYDLKYRTVKTAGDKTFGTLMVCQKPNKYFKVVWLGEEVGYHIYSFHKNYSEEEARLLYKKYNDLKFRKKVEDILANKETIDRVNNAFAAKKAVYEQQPLKKKYVYRRKGI